MSAVIGGASAKLILDVAKNEQRQPLEQVAEFVDEASQVLKFNRDLLQSTIENIQQGISWLLPFTLICGKVLCNK